MNAKAHIDLPADVLPALHSSEIELACWRLDALLRAISHYSATLRQRDTNPCPAGDPLDLLPELSDAALTRLEQVMDDLERIGVIRV